MKPLKTVFFVCNTEMGRKIEREMDQWLCLPLFDVIKVYGNFSPNLYEYPGVMKAQQVAAETGEPVMYIQSKGAVNYREFSWVVRDFWRLEFTNYYHWYVEQVQTSSPTATGPAVSLEKGAFWYNGFIANAEAWKQLDIPYPYWPNDRYKYECLFADKKIMLKPRLGYSEHGTEITNYIQDMCFKHRLILPRTIYTYVTNNCTLPIINGVNRVVFTNKKNIQVPGWRVIKIPDLICNNIKDNQICNYIKYHPHLLLYTNLNIWVEPTFNVDSYKKFIEDIDLSKGPVWRDKDHMLSLCHDVRTIKTLDSLEKNENI